MFDRFKYRGVIGVDLNDKSFQLKHRILGVQVFFGFISGMQLHPCAVYVREDVQILAWERRFEIGRFGIETCRQQKNIIWKRSSRPIKFPRKVQPCHEALTWAFGTNCRGVQKFTLEVPTNHTKRHSH